MTLLQLAYFTRIAELQSLTKAAAVIRIAQPALSRQIRRLEAELRTALLVRHAWGVSLTPAGEVLLDHARELLRRADDAAEAVAATSRAPSGHIALGVPASIATALLPPLAQVLRDKYPDLRPHFIDGFSATLHSRILLGDLDLAILYDDPALASLTAMGLLAEALLLVGHASVVGDAAETLDGKTLILPARPNRLRLIVDAIVSDYRARELTIFEADSLPAIIAMVEGAMGYTILPFSTVHRDVARGALRTWSVRSPNASRTLLLARPYVGRRATAAAAVELEIRGLVHALQGQLSWRALDGPRSP